MTGEEPELERQRRRASRQGLAYQGAFEAVVAILIVSGIGLWIDGRYETSPWGLLIGTAIGFASFVIRLLRLGKRLQELADSIEEDPKT
ncbi:MAG: AtpZ/AtpI family protein [Deltaproteobacteria bacterium]|nr:AtpZ/AtpI family protein [Deltaproteobacteria bacterium]MBW2363308.1 AtpZ/AtpI family protein [Deltaproteobacteria bacterium]